MKKIILLLLPLLIGCTLQVKESYPDEERISRGMHTERNVFSEFTRESGLKTYDGSYEEIEYSDAERISRESYIPLIDTTNEIDTNLEIKEIK